MSRRLLHISFIAHRKFNQEFISETVKNHSELKQLFSVTNRFQPVVGICNEIAKVLNSTLFPLVFQANDSLISKLENLLDLQITTRHCWILGIIAGNRSILQTKLRNTFQWTEYPKILLIVQSQTKR